MAFSLQYDHIMPQKEHNFDNETLQCDQSNKMRHHQNEECTPANRTKYERIGIGR